MSYSSHTTIFVQGLEVLASIGVHPHEHETAQPIIIDVKLDMGKIASPEDDRLAETLDYSVVADKAAEFAQEAHVQLIETLVHRIATWALDTDPRVLSATVRISKPHALINADAAGVELTLKRKPS